MNPSRRRAVGAPQIRARGMYYPFLPCITNPRRRIFVAVLLLVVGLYSLWGLSWKRPRYRVPSWNERAENGQYREDGGIGDGYESRSGAIKVRQSALPSETFIDGDVRAIAPTDNRYPPRHDGNHAQSDVLMTVSETTTRSSTSIFPEVMTTESMGAVRLVKDGRGLVSAKTSNANYSSPPSQSLSNVSSLSFLSAVADGTLPTVNTTCTNNKTLLLLHYYSSMPSLQVRADREFLFYCPKICTVWEHTGRSKYAKLADVVEFHDYGSSPPTRGFANQLYMFFTMESPLHSSLGSDYQMSKFNLLRSYHVDSDIFAAYIPIGGKHIKEIIGPPTVRFAEKNKEALAAMVISNCNAASSRLTLVRELQKHITIHSFGACLHNKDLPREQVHKGGSIPFIRRYKFYLALENSLCRDYITEKLFRAFYHGVVPIVTSYNGMPNYTLFTPNAHSYINAENFRTVKDLANHLKRVAANETLYNSYLSHRFDPSTISDTYMRLWGPQFDRRRWCTLAEKMSTPEGLEALRKRKLKADHSCAPYGSWRKQIKSSPRVHYRSPLHHQKARKLKKRIGSMRKKKLSKLSVKRSGSNTRRNSLRVIHFEPVTHALNNTLSTRPLSISAEQSRSALSDNKQFANKQSNVSRRHFVRNSDHSSLFKVKFNDRPNDDKRQLSLNSEESLKRIQQISQDNATATKAEAFSRMPAPVQAPSQKNFQKTSHAHGNRSLSPDDLKTLRPSVQKHPFAKKRTRLSESLTTNSNSKAKLYPRGRKRSRQRGRGIDVVKLSSSKLGLGMQQKQDSITKHAGHHGETLPATSQRSRSMGSRLSFVTLAQGNQTARGHKLYSAQLQRTPQKLLGGREEYQNKASARRPGRQDATLSRGKPRSLAHRTKTEHNQEVERQAQTLHTLPSTQRGESGTAGSLQAFVPAMRKRVKPKARKRRAFVSGSSLQKSTRV